MAYTHITPGWEIEMSAHYYPDKKADRVAELIQLPREELTTMEEASVAQEKAIFSKFSEIEAEWRKQAAETIAIRKAREYLRALPVEHTSNQWKVNQFGWNVLSNMVYKMSYRVSENKTPDGTLINCTLSWDIHYTVEASLEERVEEMLSFLEDDPALLEEPLSSGHQDTPQEEEPTMAQKLHTTPLNQHRNRESVQKPETARKGPKKPPRRKTAPVR